MILRILCVFLDYSNGIQLFKILRHFLLLQIYPDQLNKYEHTYELESYKTQEAICIAQYTCIFNNKTYGKNLAYFKPIFAIPLVIKHGTSSIIGFRTANSRAIV